MDPRLERALSKVLDPEVGIDIVSLGLIYAAEIDGTVARVRMAMTSPTCPMGDVMVRDAERAILQDVEGLTEAHVELIDEVWTPDRMSREARRALGWEAG